MIVDMGAAAVADLRGSLPTPKAATTRETYRSLLTAALLGSRALAILYLLPTNKQSACHRLRGDELWLLHLAA
jgi:predicted cupin superfamily sugar epimerase